ncbi:hypothetical protein FACS1894137_13730 [Spirochaetia bacterium]|nr:hypothetical protein FACS1894137_13730 [Spirochaetia bacterium]
MVGQARWCLALFFTKVLPTYAVDIYRFDGGKDRRGTMMKHKETADDVAIKNASKTQRKAEKVDLIEGFAYQKTLGGNDE